MIQLMFTQAMPPETLDAKLCCSTHSTSDREMRLLHSVLAVTGKAVVACSYGLPEGGRLLEEDLLCLFSSLFFSSSGVFTGIIHALRIKSQPPIAPLLNARHPITANGVAVAGATGRMVGHPRFQECGESGIKRRTSVSAGPRGPETEDARGYRLCIGPQCTATENKSTSKHTQTPV
ncbi:hypothetical protein DPX16_14602 [Anabarilius grahami]|uniref:Uncharacterized protein n=1 Tax=Anabarilius grahami TaxID=495550 RepID=A0A3N0YYC2_ANAGA|nr:hypothetical protein DPX16_14602 [Anabarilius grahami]